MTDHQPPADVSRHIAEALRMLEVFESVGADSFDITHTNIRQKKRGFRRAQTIGPCTCTLQINTTGSPADRHRDKKA
jgi:hypothetical protein